VQASQFHEALLQPGQAEEDWQLHECGLQERIFLLRQPHACLRMLDIKDQWCALEQCTLEKLMHLPGILAHIVKVGRPAAVIACHQ